MLWDISLDLWEAATGIRYMVTSSPRGGPAMPHVTTGTAYKYTREIGQECPSAEEAQRFCEQHFALEQYKNL